MEKQKIYLDTSVISAFFDYKKPIRQLITQKWFENNIQDYEIYISTLVLQEIDRNSNEILKSKMFGLLDSLSPILLNIDDETINLSELYRKEVIHHEVNDSIHIAVSTVNEIGAIVSWNFKHIVNLKTINAIHNINLRNNYYLIEILTIENLGGDRYGAL